MGRVASPSPVGGRSRAGGSKPLRQTMQTFIAFFIDLWIGCYCLESRSLHVQDKPKTVGRAWLTFFLVSADSGRLIAKAASLLPKNRRNFKA